MENYKSLIGKRIRERRKALGLTQEALGEAIDADQSRIARWERGAHLPDPKYRERLSKALDLPEDDLFGVQEQPVLKKPQNTSDAIAAIVTALPTLDQSELDLILDLIEGFHSARSGRRLDDSVG